MWDIFWSLFIWKFVVLGNVLVFIIIIFFETSSVLSGFSPSDGLLD